jgi:hypothetical protein
MTTISWRKCLHTSILELIFWKVYYGLENNCKLVDLWLWDKKKLLFETLVTLVILYGCEVWGCNISQES